jgi:hypothetical protein
MEKSTVPNPLDTRSTNVISYKEISSKVQQIDSSPSLPPPTEVWDYQDALTRGYNVIVKRGTNRFKLFRFLLSKIRYSKDGFHLDDYLCLWNLYFLLIEEKDPKFQKRLFLLQDENLVKVLEQLRDIRVFPYNPRETTFHILDRLPLIYHSRSYFGMESSGWSKHYRLSFNSRLVRRKPRPVPYIGVGYKDKGSRRDVALDGTPKWQIIGSISAFKEREADELLGPPPDSLEADP